MAVVGVVMVAAAILAIAKTAAAQINAASNAATAAPSLHGLVSNLGIIAIQLLIACATNLKSV